MKKRAKTKTDVIQSLIGIRAKEVSDKLTKIIEQNLFTIFKDSSSKKDFEDKTYTYFGFTGDFGSMYDEFFKKSTTEKFNKELKDIIDE